MSFFSALTFARRHGGIKAVERFVELANTVDLRTLAREFDLSVSQASRLRMKLLSCNWVPNQGVLDYLEFEKHLRKAEIEECEQFARESTKTLRLVHR